MFWRPLQQGVFESPVSTYAGQLIVSTVYNPREDTYETRVMRPSTGEVFDRTTDLSKVENFEGKRIVVPGERIDMTIDGAVLSHAFVRGVLRENAGWALEGAN